MHIFNAKPPKNYHLSCFLVLDVDASAILNNCRGEPVENERVDEQLRRDVSTNNKPDHVEVGRENEQMNIDASTNNKPDNVEDGREDEQMKKDVSTNNKPDNVEDEREKDNQIIESSMVEDTGM